MSTMRAHRPGTVTSCVAPADERIIGLDLARFVALVGMFATSVWRVDGAGGAPVLTAATMGKAAGLFAVLAGAGLALAAQRAIGDGRLGAARRIVLGRGIAVVVIGLTLGLVPVDVTVVLVFAGVAFHAVVPVLHLSNWGLVGLAAGWAVVWPALSMSLRQSFPPVGFTQPSWFGVADPMGLAFLLLVTGIAPVLTWVSYLLVGLVVGRLVIDARRRGQPARTGLQLAFGGVITASFGAAVSAFVAGPGGGIAAIARDEGVSVGVAAARFAASRSGAPPTDSAWFLASAAPHSGTFPDLAVTTGIALIVIGVLVAVGDRVGPRARRVLRPIAGAGAAPLTLYTVHVLLIGLAGLLADAAAVPRVGGTPWWVDGPAVLAVHVAVAIGVGLVLTRARRRGPLERFVTRAGRRAAEAAAPASTEVTITRLQRPERAGDVE